MLRIGMFLGDRYEILDQIGSGGMAEVYRAKCHKLNRMVAIKVLKDEFNDKSFVGKFKAEAQAAAGLSHPNIVSIYDVGDEEDIHYIVMELVEGITLKQYIEKKKHLDIKEAIGITIQVAQGIGAAHEQHIIHRDIKPQNVIISRDGKVKVTDFGIAKVASSRTINSDAVGSVYYFSPEQARGGYCDERSDIYSLGITLYEMLTGQVPFEGESTVAVALAHLQTDMIPPREIDPMIPVSLEKIILKATQKKPERRYVSAAELIADLRKALLMPDEDFVRMMPTENTSPSLLIGEDEVTPVHQNKVVTIIDEDPENEEEENTSAHHRGEVITVTPGKKDGDEGEDDDHETTVFDKVIFGFGILICIMILCIAGYILSRTLQSIRSPQETTEAQDVSTEEPTTTISDKSVKMPLVTGMPVDDARKMLKDDYNLGVVIKEESSEIIAKGIVMSQEIKEGEIVDKNTSVTLTVSTGSAKVQLPEKNEIIGKDVKVVRSLLRRLGLTVKEETGFSEDIEEGSVMEMSPAPGEKVDPKAEVLITISMGKEIQYVFVRELCGYTLEEAEDLLDMDLIIDEITEEYSDGTAYTKGQIMWQSLEVNEKVEKGTKINVKVSKGFEYTDIPAVTGKTKDEAEKLIKDAGLVLGDVKEEYSNDVEEKLAIKVVAGSADMKDNRVKIGATVELIISRGSEDVKMPQLVGKTQKEATKLLEDAGLKVGSVTKVNDDTEAGKVIKQSVASGETVTRGTQIDITVSEGKKMAKLPDRIIGENFNDIYTALSNAGFQVESTEEESDSMPAGYIVKCNYQAGQSVPYGSKVVIVVAKAKVVPTTEAPTEAPTTEAPVEAPTEAPVEE